MLLIGSRFVGLHNSLSASSDQHDFKVLRASVPQSFAVACLGLRLDADIIIIIENRIIGNCLGKDGFLFFLD